MIKLIEEDEENAQVLVTPIVNISSTNTMEEYIKNEEKKINIILFMIFAVLIVYIIHVIINE